MDRRKKLGVIAEVLEWRSTF